ncbi:MAG: oligosaccharide flippase family protein [Marinosulfonomonas sp.]|nr:oligosaccharide flippase family protein [Marinosulfonomonas sp.]
MTLNKRANTTLLIKLAAAGVTYGFMILLARVMTAADFGQVAFYLNFALLFSVIGACGQQVSLLRFLPPRRKNIHSPELRGLLSNAARLTALGTVLAFTILIVATLLARHLVGVQTFSVLSVVLGLSLILAVGWADFQAHFVRGYHRIPAAIIPKEFLWRLIVGGLVLIYSLMARPSVVTVLVFLLTTLIVLNIAQMRWIKFRVATPGLSLVQKIPCDQQWRKTIIPFWITSVSNIFLTNADVICVGLFLGPESAAYYFAANRLAMLLAFFLTSHNVVLAPMLSEAWGWGQRDQIAAMVHSTTRRTTLLTAILGAILFFAAPYFLRLFGSDFVQADLVFRLLILAAVLNAVIGPADIVLNMCGFERQAMHASAIALVASAVFLVIGAVVGGSTGIALAVLVATALRKFLFWRQTVGLMSLRTDILAAFPPSFRPHREIVL